MQNGRKLTAWLTALALLPAGVGGGMPPFPAAAYAEEVVAPELEVGILPNPGQLAAPGDIELQFTLVNRSDKALTDAYLTSSDGLISVPIGTIEAGQTSLLTLTHAVSQSELDMGAVYYVVTCEAGDERFSYPAAGLLQKYVPQPKLEFLRRVSDECTSGEGSVTIVYTVRNVGSAPIGNLVLRDPLGNYEVQLESLPVGQEQSFINRAVLTEDGVSAPTLEYASGTEQESRYTEQLDELPIRMVQGMLDVSLSAERSLFDPDTVEVILQLTNGGTVDYNDITVYDDVYGGVIEDSIRLPAGGEPVEITNNYPLRGSASYRWRITGSTSAGDAIDLITNNADYVAEAPQRSAQLTLTASASMPKISRRGYVPFTLTLTNDGDASATRIRVYEETHGDVRELAVVAPGEPTQFTVRYEIRESSELLFHAVYTDENGVEHSVSSAPAAVAIGAGGEKPESFDDGENLFGGTSFQMGNSSLFLVLLIGSCIVLVALTVILLVTSRRARKARKERAAARKQRMKEALAKTNRFTPVKRNSPKK